MRKVARGVIISLLLCMCYTSSCFAYTAEELYADCGVEYTDPHSTADMEIISAYRYAKKYTRIFGHLSIMDFSTISVDTELSTLQDRLSEIETELNAGFTLPLETIYLLESEYRDILSDIVFMQTIEDAKEVPLKQLDIAGIPTYADYTRANARNALLNTQQELGSSTPKLTPNAYVVSDYTDTSITIGTTELAVVTSLFNGEVVDVRDNIVTVDHYNNIYSSYNGIIPDVKVGDTVYQGKCIGYSEGNVSVRLRVGDVFVNIHDLLEVTE